MKKLNRTHRIATPPIKIIQFGEGNFLRAFVDYAFQQLNDKADFNGGIAVVQPIDRGLVSMLNDQDGLYTLFLRGVQNDQTIDEKHLISTIVKGINPYEDFQAYLDLAKEDELEYIISNTTEAGIAYIAGESMDAQPPKSFPAKVTRLLWERYKHFEGAKDKGLKIIPCELINYNADQLKKYILQYSIDWDLDAGFIQWIEAHNSFHNTLVDRIVPGYPKDEIEFYNAQLDYKDQLIVVAESFFLWVIEDDGRLKSSLAFDKTDCDVKFVESIQPYRNRKVRILNGIHTSLVPVSYLYGNRTVTESMNDSFTSKFVHDMVFDEIIDTIDMDKDELIEFTNQVMDRFKNPFIIHQLASIALNSISKFKVRVLPSLLIYVEKCNRLPLHLCFSLAALIRFYKGEWKGETLPVQDDASVIAFMQEQWKSNDISALVEAVLSNETLWGTDLSTIPDLSKILTSFIKDFDTIGIEETYRAQLEK